MRLDVGAGACGLVKYPPAASGRLSSLCGGRLLGGVMGQVELCVQAAEIRWRLW